VKADMRALAALMETARGADAMALAKVAARVEALRGRADALRHPPALPDGADAFGMAAADRHALWRASRRRALLGELALAMAEWEVARDRAQRSFGRAGASEELARREKR
jgi:hypothetical protein